MELWSRKLSGISILEEYSEFDEENEVRIALCLCRAERLILFNSSAQDRDTLDANLFSILTELR